MEDVSWIYNLRPVNFEYKDNIGNKRYGLIAEEVETINKDIVFYKEGKIEGVHYDRLIPILLKEIQNLKKEIESLKTNI